MLIDDPSRVIPYTANDDPKRIYPTSTHSSELRLALRKLPDAENVFAVQSFQGVRISEFELLLKLRSRISLWITHSDTVLCGSVVQPTVKR